MARYSIEDFVETTMQRNRGEGTFELERDRLLEVNLNGRVWTKTGAMVAYTGAIKFTREGIPEHGLGRLFKEKLTGESIMLTKAEGQGALYLADGGKKISILNLAGETLFVNGNDLLAFEDSIQWDVTLMRRVAGMMAGGISNVRLGGQGMVAITTYYDPLTLKVEMPPAIMPATRRMRVTSH